VRNWTERWNRPVTGVEVSAACDEVDVATGDNVVLEASAATVVEDCCEAEEAEVACNVVVAAVPVDATVDVEVASAALVVALEDVVVPRTVHAALQLTCRWVSDLMRFTSTRFGNVVFHIVYKHSFTRSVFA
jgi:hypothetical protein